MKELLERIYNAAKPEKEDLKKVLSLTSPEDIKKLSEFANDVALKHVGNKVFLRGIVEISNICDNTCLYCGLNKYNKQLSRYKMEVQEAIDACRKVCECGIETIVIQSGESKEYKKEDIAAIVSGIKQAYPNCAITLSLGEYDYDSYALWKQAGADRYLIKQETTSREVYEKLHPGMSYDNRIRCADDLRKLGYQVGSGVLVGIPGQTIDILADDILFFQAQEFDMLGIGPFIPHKQTELKECNQGDVLMTVKMVALTRIVTKNAHLPATTALGSVKEGDLRIDALKAGANVLMPNFTPAKYKAQYEIYPNKRCIDEPTGACALCMQGIVESVGKEVEFSRGDSFKRRKKYHQMP